MEERTAIELVLTATCEEAATLCIAGMHGENRYHLGNSGVYIYPAKLAMLGIEVLRQLEQGIR